MSAPAERVLGATGTKPSSLMGSRTGQGLAKYGQKCYYQ